MKLEYALVTNITKKHNLLVSKHNYSIQVSVILTKQHHILSMDLIIFLIYVKLCEVSSRISF